MHGEYFLQFHSRNSSTRFASGLCFAMKTIIRIQKVSSRRDILKMACLILQFAIPPRLCLVLDVGGFFLPRSLVQSFSKNNFCSVCPAAHMGLSTVWIMAASMLSAFDILKPLDEQGTPIDPTVEYIFGLTLCAYICFY